MLQFSVGFNFKLCQCFHLHYDRLDNSVKIMLQIENKLDHLFTLKDILSFSPWLYNQPVSFTEFCNWNPMYVWYLLPRSRTAYFPLIPCHDQAKKPKPDRPQEKQLLIYASGCWVCREWDRASFFSYFCKIHPFLAAEQLAYFFQATLFLLSHRHCPWGLLPRCLYAICDTNSLSRFFTFEV